MDRPRRCSFWHLPSTRCGGSEAITECASPRLSLCQQDLDFWPESCLTFISGLALTCTLLDISPHGWMVREVSCCLGCFCEARRLGSGSVQPAGEV
ncbi:hypothetical protein BJX66DRAFT_314114 [Aspergillus keveii]|uniref:Uncharacterized protein n=1 Tax=Aspergillus keveii TaxID=714993 RepID=A0ABR4FRE2_9EURO